MTDNIFAQWKDCFGCSHRGVFILTDGIDDVREHTKLGKEIVERYLQLSLDDYDIKLCSYACVPTDGAVYYV